MFMEACYIKKWSWSLFHCTYKGIQRTVTICGNCITLSFPFNSSHTGNLLRKIIEEADEAIAKKGHGATLRFGHETIVLPLICLLGLNGFDRQFENLEDLDVNGWINFDVFPMAANVQWVFYRKNPQDKDVLFKILLNEKESWLPIPTDCEPYYHWKDFREFYLKKLDAYQE